jgi:hypothetical protein
VEVPLNTGVHAKKWDEYRVPDVVNELAIPCMSF